MISKLRWRMQKLYYLEGTAEVFFFYEPYFLEIWLHSLNLYKENISVTMKNKYWHGPFPPINLYYTTTIMYNSMTNYKNDDSQMKDNYKSYM